MKKKVLILSGSPRKNGNSDFLCNQFFKGAKKAVARNSQKKNYMKY